MAKGDSTTQQQQVSQSTSVTVQNVIEDKGLDPLERLNLLATVFEKIDSQNRAQVPSSVVSVQNIPSIAFLKDPTILSILLGGAALLIFIVKRRR
jgi:hypothetical protein